MNPWLVPRRRPAATRHRGAPRRVVEATPEQIAMTGAAGGSGWDPIDGVAGWSASGARRRDMPPWTLERARQSSIAGYRSNPMAKAIIDTYVAFAVGDSGVTLTVTNPKVKEIADQFWHDPRNRCADIQEIGLRSGMLMGERAVELLTGATTGVVRFAPLDTSLIEEVRLLRGNPHWPAELVWRSESGLEEPYPVAAPADDAGMLRQGRVAWWVPWRTLETDTRSMPFLTPVLDWLDNYDRILSDLMDRTAIARYAAWDVTINGDQTDVDDYVAARGGRHMPPTGTVEIHNQDVQWKPMQLQTGAYEDSVAAKLAMTLVAGGAGLARTWLADPEDSNRATSLTMAEPVRRRVQSVQKEWLAHQADIARYAVDRAVAAGRIPPMVTAVDPRTGAESQVRASESVIVTGPEIAANDAQITAETMLNLSTGLGQLVEIGAMPREAAALAAQKAWEDYVGVPYRADLGDGDSTATYIEEQAAAQQRRPAPARAPLRPVPERPQKETG